ncbi:hypothetical protein, partial [Otoolea muris]|uniref:hypothetical protein n=1 Tax=Otoolea muris TaxID=2941515 RepID=UPI00203E4F97
TPKNSNPDFTGERHIFHYTFLFDAYDSPGTGAGYETNQRKRQILMRSDAKLPQPFASWSNSL